MLSKTSGSRLSTSLTGKEHSQHPREGKPLNTSCEGWDASPVHGAVSALQDKLRTWFAQGVCPTGNGAELLSAYATHQLLCHQDPPG